MAITKIRGNSQIMDLTIQNLQIATDAAIELSKLEKSVIAADGTVAMTGDLALGGNNITGVADPINNTDVATKQYVDSVAQGLAVHAPVLVATTEELAVTAAGAGIGKTLTANANGAIVIDGTTVAAGKRVLLKDQSTAADNGVYTVTATGNAGAPFVLTRATDFDGSPQAEIVDGAFFFVETGTANGDNGYVLTSGNPVVVDGAIDPYTTSDITFIQFSGAGSVVAGAGLTKTGNIMNVGQGDGITVSADSIAVDAAALAGAGLENDGAGALRIAAAAAGNGLTGGAGSALAVGAGDGISVTADAVAVNASALAGAGLANDGSNNLAVQVDNSTIQINGSNQLEIKSVGDFLKIAKIITREPANGTINHVNKIFTLAATPVLGTEQVFLNGILQDQGAGEDYTISGATITFTDAPINQDKIRVTYISQ